MQPCTCSSMPADAGTGSAFPLSSRLAQADTHPSDSLASPEGAIAFATEDAASLIYTQHGKRLGQKAWDFKNGVQPKQGSGTLAASCHAVGCFDTRAGLCCQAQRSPGSLFSDWP